jgi:hypothetical protein
MPMVVVNPPASAFNIQPLTETPAIAPALDELAVFSDSAVAMRKVKVANLYPNGGLSGAKLAPNSVPNSALAPASIANDRIALATIDSTRIAAGGIATANYANLSVTGAKIAADTITTSNLATALKNVGRCSIFEERRGGTDAPVAFTSSTGWAQRTLNSATSNDPVLGITFSSGGASVTIPAGTWLLEGWASSGGSGRNALGFSVVTVPFVYGQVVNAGSVARASQIITLASPQVCTLSHVFSGTVNLGSALGLSTSVSYTTLKITKLG